MTPEKSDPLNELLKRQHEAIRKWLRDDPLPPPKPDDAAGGEERKDHATLTETQDARKNVTDTSEADDALGMQMLHLLSDWSWIHRRVEDIQVVDGGQTRRRVSFDLDPPLIRPSGAEPTGGSAPDQVHVPLTFLRKGMLINLDLENHDGTTLAAISRLENTRLVFHPIRMLVDRLDLVALAGEHFPNTGLKGPQFQELIELGVLHVCLSRDFHAGTKSRKSVERRQEVHRHNVFVALGQILHNAVDRDSGAAHQAQPVQVPLQQIDGEPQFDSSRPVQLLAYLIAAKIRNTLAASTADDEDQDQDRIAQLQMLTVLLAVTSVGYLFGVVFDDEPVADGRPAQDRSPRRGRRRVIKLSCDVEPLPIEQRWFQRLSCLWDPRLNLHVRHTQWAAHSNHLSFTPPKNAVINKVTRFEEPAQWVNEKFKADRHLVDRPGHPPEQTSSAAERPVKKRRSRRDHDKQDQEDAFDVVNGSYRVSQNRLHIANIRPSNEAVRSLEFRLVPVRSPLPLVAAVISAALAALLLSIGLDAQMRAFFHYEFNLTELIETETLIIAVFGAIYLTTGRHHLELSLSRWTRAVVMSSMAIAILAPLILMILVSNYGRHHWPHNPSLVLVVCAVLVLVGAVIGTCRSGTRLSGLSTDSVIESDSDVTPSERSMLAVTEIDPFDVGYLSTDDRDRLTKAMRKISVGTEAEAT